MIYIIFFVKEPGVPGGEGDYKTKWKSEPTQNWGSEKVDWEAEETNRLFKKQLLVIHQIW